MTDIHRRRGQPLVFLFAVFAVWISARVAMWEQPWPEPRQFIRQAPLAPVAKGFARTSPHPLQSGGIRQFPGDSIHSPHLTPIPERAPPATLERAYSVASEDDVFVRGVTGVGHNLLWMAAMAALPLPQEVQAAAFRSSQPAMTPGPSDAAKRTTEKRWRADAWLTLREGPAPLAAPGGRPPTYGGSQLGAVLAYRLAPSAPRDPAVYARVSKALVPEGDSELALGIRARPLPRIPLAAHVEGRVSKYANGTEVRPAAFLSAGAENIALPLGVRAEGYAQAGWVGGSFTTPFADGAVRLGREFRPNGNPGLELGLAAWGGAQKGANRVDIGPSIRLELDGGKATVRLSADYRLRVAGDAEPASGPALTLISGF